MTRISVPDGFFASLPCPDKSTNHNNQTNFLHYFKMQDFHKADSCWDIKTLSAFTKPDSSSAHSQNPTFYYPHIKPGEYNPQHEFYFCNTELVSPPPKHHFPAGKFPHFLKITVSTIRIFCTQATYKHTSLSFAS